jgi:hypothetical protein
MKEEFEKLVAAGKLDRHQVEPLVQLTEQRLLHASELGFWEDHHGGHGVRPVHD